MASGDKSAGFMFDSPTIAVYNIKQDTYTERNTITIVPIKLNRMRLRTKEEKVQYFFKQCTSRLWNSSTNMSSDSH